MHRNLIPEMYPNRRHRPANPIPWLTALSIAAIVIGGTLALVIAN